MARVRERGIDRIEAECLVANRHGERAINRGRAQWRVSGPTPEGRILVVVYDHPHGVDVGAARIVSAWIV